VTIRATLKCNGMEGVYPCHQATPVGEVLTAAEARRVAKDVHGWTSTLEPDGVVLDWCKQCTKRRLESLIPRPRPTGTCTTCGRPADPHPYRHPITTFGGR